MKRCQGKFVENEIHFDKFKESCGYLGSGEIVSSVTFVTYEILVHFKRKKMKVYPADSSKILWKLKGNKNSNDK